MSPSMEVVHKNLLKNLGEQGNYSEDTLRAIQSDLGIFLRQLEEDLDGQVDIEKALTRGILLDFLGAEVVAASTRRRRLFSLRLLTGYAVRQGMLAEDPLSSVGIADLLADKEKAPPPHLAEEQMEAMLASAQFALGNADPFPMLMIGVLLSGLRVSEAVALTWEDFLIDDAGSISFSVEGRSIPLSSRIEQDAFQVAIHLGRRMSSERVLGVKRRALSDRFRVFLRGVGGLDDLHLKDLRWRAMLDMAAEGRSGEEIASICGVTTSYLRRILFSDNRL